MISCSILSHRAKRCFLEPPRMEKSLYIAVDRQPSNSRLDCRRDFGFRFIVIAAVQCKGPWEMFMSKPVNEIPIFLRRTRRLKCRPPAASAKSGGQPKESD